MKYLKNSNFIGWRLVIIVFLSRYINIMASAKVETYEFTFDKYEFRLDQIDEGKWFLLPSNRGFYYLGEGYPCLPVYPVTIAIPKGYRFDTYSTQIEMTAFQKGVQLTGCPVIHKIGVSTPPSFFQYKDGQYPDSICKIRNADSFNGIDLYHFEIIPFSYNSLTRVLNIAENIVLKINLRDEVVNTERSGISGKSGENYRLLETFVYNQEAIDSHRPDVNVNTSVPVGTPIQYLIVTSDSLKDSFLPLLNWKRTKGLYSSIITVEEIERTYKGQDIQLKIKNCLKELYDNNGLKYVLLGGDDRVVPVRYCNGHYRQRDPNSNPSNPTYENVFCNIPSDYYYACFDGDFEWAMDKKGICYSARLGEWFYPSISVTRIPVRTPQHVSNIVSKIMEYETAPKYKGKFLCSGSEMFRSFQGRSDAEYKGGVFKKIIHKSWSGIVNELYDTNSNIKDDSGDKIKNTLANLLKEISSGYSFIENFSHGNESFFECSQNEVFAVKDAQNLKTEGHTILTTISCLTNAFDSDVNEPCLSEALIRSRDSGVIAYLGCSREGFGFSGKEGDGETNMDYLFGSLDFDIGFYNCLFSDKIYSRSYGDIVNMMKISMISTCFDTIYQWLMFGVNPIGDPEMSIYIEEPRSFSCCSVTVDADKLSIYSGEPDTRICVSSIGDDDSFYKVFDAAGPIELNDLPKQYQVCLTKDGFIPYLFSVCNIQNEVFDGNNDFSFDIVRIGSEVDSYSENGGVIFRSGISKVSGKEILIEKEVEIVKGAEVEFISE